MKKNLTDVLGLKHPIFQAPMAGGIKDAAFVSSVSNFGMLGAVASGYLTLSQLAQMLQETKANTAKPFSVNLFVDYTQYEKKAYQKPPEIIALEKELGMDATQVYEVPPPPSMDDLVALMIKEKVPVVSTTFGLLNSAHRQALAKSGAVLFTTVNSTSELSKAIDSHQSNFFIYQNALAGGHMGGFGHTAHSTEEEMLRMMQDHPELYVVLAGGIVTKKEVQHALAQGFDGVQIGTAFLTTEESSAPQSYKKAITTQGESDHTLFTQSITGKQARGVSNRIARLHINENPGFPWMHYATAALRQHARKHGMHELQSLWAGAHSYKIHSTIPLKKLMESLV